DDDSMFGKASALIVAVGTVADDAPPQKGTSFQTWLFGYELPDTLMVITATNVVFVTSQKKGTILETAKLPGDAIPFEVLKRTKDENHNADLFAKAVQAIAGSNDGKTIGVVAKDRFDGKFITEWKSAIEKSGKKFDEVDISGGIATLMAVKDEDELRSVRLAGKLCSIYMKDYFVPEMSDILDEDRKVKHSKLSRDMEDALLDGKSKKIKYPQEITPDLADWAYPPIVQSGGKYDLRFSAESNNETLEEGAIICLLGIRYKSYYANIGRTYLINPDKDQEKNYRFLLELQKYVISNLKDGITCKEAYGKAVAYIESKRPDLKDVFLKNCGFGIGVEFRDMHYTLSPKSNKVLKAGMTINVVIGFQGIQDETNKKKKSYSLILSDTVKINGGNEAPQIFTDVSKDPNEAFMYLVSSWKDAQVGSLDV
ncbi:FACT complex subunit SPT16 N-terminal lobe domain-containing protein, partial [Blyttiomyces helicus]